MVNFCSTYLRSCDYGFYMALFLGTLGGFALVQMVAYWLGMDGQGGLLGCPDTFILCKAFSRLSSKK